MFENIGGKIKGLAQTVFAIEAAIAVIGGIMLMVDDKFFIGLLTIFAGPFIAWVSSFVLYGFGELVEMADSIYECMNGGKKTDTIPKNLSAEERDRIAMEKSRSVREQNAKKLLDQGLITEEQYRKTIGEE